MKTKNKYSIKVKRTKEGLRIDGDLCEIKRGREVIVIENGSTGGGHSAHPNIDKTGSVKGMKSRGFWRKDDRTLKQGGFIYNMSSVFISDNLDALAYFVETGGQFTEPAKVDEWEETTFEFEV